jgi:hypothetical protein
MSNAFLSSAFGTTGGGSDATKLPLTGGALTGALSLTTSAATTSAPGFSTTQNWSGSTAARTANLNNVVDSRTGAAINGFLESWNVNGTPVLSIHRGDQFNNFTGGLSKNNTEPVSFVYNSVVAVQVGGNGVGTGVGIQFASTSNGFLSFANAQNYAVQHGDVHVGRGGAAILQLGKLHATSATNQTIQAHGVTTGTGPDLCLKGGTGSVANGNVRFGTHSALGVELVTGFITIKDESGTLRKLAVVS